jgi:hypothetical protein
MGAWIGTSWRWVVSFMHRPLYPRGKNPTVTDWVGGWADNRTDMDDMEKWKFLTLSGLEFPTHRSLAPQPVAIQTKLHFKILKSHKRPWTYQMQRSATEHSSTCHCIRLYTICWTYWYRLQIKWDTIFQKSFGRKGSHVDSQETAHLSQNTKIESSSGL